MALHLHHANKWNALSNVWLTDLRVKYASVTQLDRVPRYERGRHGFKSYRLHSLICPNDGIGRHAALKKLCRKACEIVAHFGYQMVVSSANRKDKNEIVPCMVDKPITHLLNLLKSCTASLAIITKG